MQLTVYHQFQPLSIENGGKQHRFSWREWSEKDKQSKFILHAMYQSGDDKIAASNAIEAKRGEVLRLQFDENGKCEPGSGIELKIDDPSWKENNYKKIANHILHNLKTGGEYGEPLNDKQKTAVFTQLASVYNLLATQYGTKFIKGIQSSGDTKDSLDELITDRKLRTLSKYFEGLAQDMLAEKEPNINSLNFPPNPTRDEIPKWTLTHGIEVKDGAKGHPFAIWKRKENLPASPDPNLLNKNSPYYKVAEAMYMSGELGDKIAVFPMDEKNPMKIIIGNGLGLTARLGKEAMKYHINEGTIQSLIDPVPVIQNAKIIEAGIKKGTVNQDQAISALLMLASLNRLVATRYNGEFGYDPDGKNLTPHYFDESDKDASIAKNYANKIAQERKDTFDIFVKDNRMYTRPISISNASSLSEFISDSKFEKEADSYLDVASKMMSGKSLEQSVQEANIPQWTLAERISERSQIVYR